MKRYKKAYKDPHAALKAALALLLAIALYEKRKLILAYVADNGTAGLLDYADTILDQGWDKHFSEAAAILAAASVDSSLETLDASGLDYSDQFVSNVEKHHEQIAKSAAADLLGLAYDHTRDVAIPTLVGWSIGASLLEQLGKVHEQAVAEEWPTEKLDTAIEDMSAFSKERAEQMAHNALTLVDGQAARIAAAASGATVKRSLTVSDDKVCPNCVQNWRDGWIGINDRFSGSDTEDVPHHPNCRCDVEYDWAVMPEELAAATFVSAFNPSHDPKTGEFTSGEIFDAAIKNHGETKDINETGFILPDGRMPDMSEGQKGKRVTDHEKLKIPLRKAKNVYYQESATDIMLEHGAVRIACDSRVGMIHAGPVPITFEQKGKLGRLVDKYNGKIIVAVQDKNTQTVHDKAYEEGTKSVKILGDIARAQRGETIRSSEAVPA